MSNHHPNPYKSNTEERHYVFVESGKKIELTVKEFKLEKSTSSGFCSYDYITIDDRDGGRILGRTCATQLYSEGQYGIAHKILSTSNCIKLYFTSDIATNEIGFKFEWRTVEADGIQSRSILPITKFLTYFSGAGNFFWMDSIWKEREYLP